MAAMTAKAGRSRRRLGSKEPALEGFGGLVGLLPEFLGSMVLQLSVVQLDN